MVDAGHDVTLVAPGGSETRAQLHAVFDTPRFEEFGDVRIEAVQALSAYRLRHEFDIVHDHTAAVGPAVASLADGPPVVHTLHNAWDDVQAELARLVSPPVRLVAISEDQAKRAPQDVTIAAVVHNGIPLERYPFEVEKEDYLLWVGRASPDKGPVAAIEIARRMEKSLAIAIKINQQNEWEYWEDVVEPRIRSSPIDIEVFPNATHDIKSRLMAKAAVLLVPIAWAEPFGLVMPEANACGTPVVAFEEGAVSEVVADGETGFVVPTGDLDAFCAAVDKAGDIDPVSCREHVERHFSAERMVAEYERTYEMVEAVDLRDDVTIVL